MRDRRNRTCRRVRALHFCSRLLFRTRTGPFCSSGPAKLCSSRVNPPTVFFFLIQGMMKLYEKVSGAELLCRVVTPGMVFGEEGAFNGKRRNTARAADACQVVELTASDFGEGAQAVYGWRWLADRLENQAADCQTLHGWVRNHKVENRIILLLATLAGEVGPRLPLSQSDIGSLVGATRETSSTLLNRLERRGLVQLGRGAIVVPSASELRRSAPAS
jgi:CRP-like cAMP-binding protein